MFEGLLRVRKNFALVLNVLGTRSLCHRNNSRSGYEALSYSPALCNLSGLVGNRGCGLDMFVSGWFTRRVLGCKWAKDCHGEKRLC